jgi:hypothetical protein
MAVPIGRTILESHIYMELRPCVCGTRDLTITSSELIGGGDGGFIRRHVGRCPACEASREFVFGLPDNAVIGGVSWEMYFGGDAPSQLIDAGEWMEIAERVARSIHSRPDPDPVALRDQREALTVAVAAVNEALKFIPDGVDEVPDDAFWTDLGRAKQHELYGRFRRFRLQAYRSGLLDVLEGLGGPLFNDYPWAEGWGAEATGERGQECENDSSGS